MKELLEDLIENWRGETRPARKMSVENLSKFNKYFALELEHLWHNSTSIFVEGEDEAALFIRRLNLTNGQATVEGSISHREYNQHLTCIRFSDHSTFGPLLLNLDTSETIEVTNEED